MEGNVTITKDAYLRLRKAEIKLNMLKRGGVDNWEWYGESLNPEGEMSYEEEIEAIEKIISVM
jgi:hypothetical protein